MLLVNILLVARSFAPVAAGDLALSGALTSIVGLWWALAALLLNLVPFSISWDKNNTAEA